jgi:hypothetical protein
MSAPMCASFLRRPSAPVEFSILAYGVDGACVDLATLYSD